ncbi:MAG: pantetheine-phosphate adenylyltransferase [Clostridia bacterium]|nr:pantetheine-phosphate adenylyltransferase [Clostridia bacterium]
MKTCVFAGTFDPFTNGHEFIVNKCLDIFDRVIIAVGVNVDKKPMFTTRQRVNAIKSVFADNKKVKVYSFSGMLVDFMKNKGVTVTVRGLRNADDYKYETTMADYNADLYPEITTLYIPTPANLSYVSSSAMRNILGLKGDIKGYIPEKAYEYLKDYIK